MSGSPAPGSPPPAPSLYERWSDRLTDWCPYVTLALSSVLALAWSTDSAGERLVTAGLVALAAVWVYLGYTRAPRPRKAHRVRMIVYFIGLLAIAVAAGHARVHLLHLPDHGVLPRHGAATVAAPHRRRLCDVGPRQHGDRRVPDERAVVDDLGGDHRDPDARDRGRRAPRREAGRAERTTAPGGGSSGGGSRRRTPASTRSC